MPTVSEDRDASAGENGGDEAARRSATRGVSRSATRGVSRSVSRSPARRGLSQVAPAVPRSAVAALLGVLAFALVVVLVTTGWAPLARLDLSVATDMAATFDPDTGWASFLVIVHQLTQPWLLRAVGVIVAGILVARGRRLLGAWLVTTIAVGVLLDYGLKYVIGRPRPELADPILRLPGNSLPSGHAFTSALVIGALLVVLAEFGASRRDRIAAWTGALLVIVLVGVDRVALTVHYVSDVLAGWALAFGLLGATVLTFGLGRRRPRARRSGRSRRRLAIVLNPSKVEDVAHFRRQMEYEAAGTGWDPPMWFETTVDDPGHAMVGAALEAGADLVVAAGGDGTVRVVCGGLAGTGVPVGIVPVGTGNLLVRNLGLPLDHHAAIRVALTGLDRTLNLVRVEGDGLPADRFAVMAGLGLDAAVVGEAPAKLKATVGWAAYAVSVVRNLSFPAIRVDITVDDEPTVRGWVRTVLIGNVGTLHGGLSLLPDAQPDDGMLDVVAVAPRRLTDWPGLAWRVARRSPAQDDRLRTWRGRRVVVRAQKACPRQLDGDVIEMGEELRCEIEPGVLLVRFPRRGVAQW